MIMVIAVSRTYEKTTLKAREPSINAQMSHAS
jgi:hypothetical protein